jgi:hypothetical protein
VRAGAAAAAAASPNLALALDLALALIRSRTLHIRERPMESQPAAALVAVAVDLAVAVIRFAVQRRTTSRTHITPARSAEKLIRRAFDANARQGYLCAGVLKQRGWLRAERARRSGPPSG